MPQTTERDDRGFREMIHGEHGEGETAHAVREFSSTGQSAVAPLRLAWRWIAKSITFFKKGVFATLLPNVMMGVTLVGPMLLAAAGIAALLFLVGAGPQWPWFAWILVAPIIYLCWVIMYLAICAFSTRRMGRRYPKPRHFVTRPGQGRSPESLGFRTASMCHWRWALVEKLPFARATGMIPCLSKLWMRAYSPTLHLGSGVLNLGFISDPDLTEIGDNALIGSVSAVVAHITVARGDGTLVFTSAPIRIGHRVTVGGGASVALGCIIGDDAVLEPCAVVPPFTKIPAGEVWGGHPATFLRKRMGSARAARHNRGAVVSEEPSRCNISADARLDDERNKPTTH